MMRLLLVLAAVTFATPSRADMWCAQPLVVHEWGVHVFSADGQPTLPVALPPWFHTRLAPTSPGMPVKQLPADSGIRTLPVLHFYGQGAWPIPVGIEVGFKGGEPGVWYPGVDRIAGTELPGPRRLVWDRLDLSATPRKPPLATDLAWVIAARALPALWVERPNETERFVFYEAATQERVPLALRRGPKWTSKRREMVLSNHGGYPVHDVFFVHREGSKAYAVEVALIAPGQTTTIVVDDHPLTVALAPRLTGLLVEPRETDARTPRTCVTGRDPAVPTSRASGHRLYQEEVDLIMRIWGARFFDTQGTSILYREGTPQLDEEMPLSIYTDMNHFIELRRAGLALWQGLTL